MSSPGRPEPLEHEHTPEAVARRLSADNQHGDLGDFVLGAIDGTITTFAIVSGVAGAQLSPGVAIVLGLANVLADGFSMAVGNYLKACSDAQIVDRYRRIEEKHIQRAPEGEREEIRQIFAAKGFSGEMLEQIVNVIAADRRRWVDTMLTEEWGLSLRTASPRRAAAVTFAAFVLAGIIPLMPLPLSLTLGQDATFAVSAAATAITFATVGAIRGRIAKQSMLSSAAETLVMGSVAAGLAYAVGALLRGLTGL